MSSKRGQEKIISVIGSIFLAITYIAIGYALCSGVPYMTELIGKWTVSGEDSPFSKEQLVDGALAVREYSFGTNNPDPLYQTISDMNVAAQTPYAEYSLEELPSAPIQYTIDEEQLSHLDDVHSVTSSAMFPMLGLASISAFMLMAALMLFGTRVLGRMLLYAGLAGLGVLAVLGLWALVSFDSLFSVFHSLFFQAGTWTFPGDSLLITMLPEGFWTGMALLWISASALISVLSAVLGRVLVKRSPQG